MGDFFSTGQILHIWETNGTDGTDRTDGKDGTDGRDGRDGTDGTHRTDMIDPFKDDFPGHLCRAAFAIPAMFQTFL